MYEMLMAAAGGRSRHAAQERPDGSRRGAHHDNPVLDRHVHISRDGAPRHVRRDATRSPGSSDSDGPAFALNSW